MKGLKEKLHNLYKKTYYYQSEKIREEWEQQNIKIDEQQTEINKLIKKCGKLNKENEKNKNMFQEEIEFRKQEISKLEEINSKISERLKEKEKARRKLAGKIGGYQSKINRLETQVKFLKTNRRAPKLEEIKNYEFKRTKCKG